MTTLTLDFQFERDLTLALCRKIATPVAREVERLLLAEDYLGYLNLTLDPGSYQSPGDFADDYLVAKVLSKSKMLPTGLDTRARAIESFLDSERHCHATTTRLLEATTHPKWWSRFKWIIRNILGPLNNTVLEEISERCKHGPGGSVGVRAAGMCRSDKFDYTPSVTEELAPFATSLMGDCWSSYRPHLHEVPGSTFFTVPKNAKTDRCCATEPTVNQYLQLGIGAYLAKRLRYSGVDITDQSRNQFLASVAHVQGLATLDLSSASDLISCGLVFLALPSRWRQLLSLARSRRMLLSDETIVLEKFCTMGNGFTFALETIVFFALCKAVCEEGSTVSAYGDDLIVPQKHVTEVIDGLEYLGFQINRSKSCLAGNFFESCGSDWFMGTNVRPFFLRRDPKDLVPYHLRAANMLRLWSSRRFSSAGCDGRFQSIWESLRDSCPGKWKTCVVPPGVGDVGFISPLSESSDACIFDPAYQRRRFRYRRISTRPVAEDKRTFGVLLAGLAGLLPDDSPVNFLEPIREPMFTYGLEPKRGLYGLEKPRWAICDIWPDGLDWLTTS